MWMESITRILHAYIRIYHATRVKLQINQIATNASRFYSSEKLYFICDKII